MTWPIALQVYQHLSVSNMSYMEQAYQWYKLALERQTEAFGDRHQRTRRIRAEVADMERRRKAAEENEHHEELIVSMRAAAEEEERKAAARKVEADQLMDQFLTGLREERKAAEQTEVSRRARTPPPAKPPSSAGDL